MHFHDLKMDRDTVYNRGSKIDCDHRDCVNQNGHGHIRRDKLPHEIDINSCTKLVRGTNHDRDSKICHRDELDRDPKNGRDRSRDCKTQNNVESKTDRNHQTSHRTHH